MVYVDSACFLLASIPGVCLMSDGVCGDVLNMFTEGELK
jgi:hypothetical protein